MLAGGEVKVVDFGVARRLDGERPQARRDRVGGQRSCSRTAHRVDARHEVVDAGTVTVFGTPAYMAPEVLFGEPSTPAERRLQPRRRDPRVPREAAAARRDHARRDDRADHRGPAAEGRRPTRRSGRRDARARAGRSGRRSTSVIARLGAPVPATRRWPLSRSQRAGLAGRGRRRRGRSPIPRRDAPHPRRLDGARGDDRGRADHRARCRATGRRLRSPVRSATVLARLFGDVDRREAQRPRRAEQRISRRAQRRVGASTSCTGSIEEEAGALHGTFDLIVVAVGDGARERSPSPVRRPRLAHLVDEAAEKLARQARACRTPGRASEPRARREALSRGSARVAARHVHACARVPRAGGRCRSELRGRLVRARTRARLDRRRRRRSSDEATAKAYELATAGPRKQPIEGIDAVPRRQQFGTERATSSSRIEQTIDPGGSPRAATTTSARPSYHDGRFDDALRLLQAPRSRLIPRLPTRDRAPVADARSRGATARQASFYRRRRRRRAGVDRLRARPLRRSSPASTAA